MENMHDVIIVGGGIVGTSLALILAKSAMKVALVEARDQYAKSSSERPIVLSHCSRVIFESIDVWNKLAPRTCPIRKIHVSDQGHFGSTQILAEEEKLPALGYVIKESDINETLSAELGCYSNITLIQPAKFISSSYAEPLVNVVLEKNGNKISLIGKLLIAADGQQSVIRKFLNIQVSTKDYQQSAILCQIGLKRSHQETAFERFSPHGPLAILPLSEKVCAVVWTVKKESAPELLMLSEDQFLQKLQKSFGYRLGKILHCTQPISVDLQLFMAKQQIVPGTVLIGNAVHTLHPVAGQGLNLALRDVAVLAEEIYRGHQKGEILGSMELLQRYISRRSHDQRQIIHLTHSLVGVFSNSFLPLIFARGFGMFLLDRIQWIKKILTKRTLGIAGKVPRLVCGMDLE